MKTIITTVLVLASLAAFGQAADRGQIYFIRDTGFMGYSTAFNVFIDSTIVCKLNNSRYSLHDATEGKHMVTVQFDGKELKKEGKKDAVDVNVQIGKAYYFKIVQRTGYLSKSDVYLEEMTESAAKRLMEQCKGTDTCL